MLWHVFPFCEKNFICKQLTRKAAFFSEPCIVDYRRINGPDKPSGPLYMHVSYMQRRIQKGGGGGGLYIYKGPLGLSGPLILLPNNWLLCTCMVLKELRHTN